MSVRACADDSIGNNDVGNSVAEWLSNEAGSQEYGTEKSHGREFVPISAGRDSPQVLSGHRRMGVRENIWNRPFFWEVL